MANLFAALVSIPAVILDESIEFVKRIFRDEEDIIEGKNLYEEKEPIG